MKKLSYLFLFIFILSFSLILSLVFYRNPLSNITRTKIVKSFGNTNLKDIQRNSDNDKLDLEIPLNPNNNGNSFTASINLNNSFDKEGDILISLYERDTNKLIYDKHFNIIKGESVIFPKIFYENKDISYILKIKAENKEILKNIVIFQNEITLKFINSICYIFQALLYTLIFCSLIAFLYYYKARIFNIKNISIFIITSTIVLTLFGYLYNNFNWDIVNVPLYLVGIDDFHFLSVAKNAVDRNSFWYMNDMGAPFGVARYNFPMLMAFYYDFCYFFGFFTNNAIFITNLYYILTFILAVFGFVLVAKELKINYYLAVLGGIIFSFSQYHIFRSTHHLTASSYFVVTLVLYFCLHIVLKDKFNNWNLKIADKIKIYSSLILSSFLIGSVDIFYAYFGCAFIALCLLMALFSKRYIASLRGLFFIIMILLVLVNNLYPSILNSIIHGTTKTSMRAPYEVFFYGLSLVHLFMPRTFGEFHIFSWLTQSYNNSRLFRSEATASYLGIIGIIGFLVLLSVLLIDSFRKILQKYEENSNKGMLKFLSRLNIFALLLGLQSAIGVFVALVGFTKVRTYNRISVYILLFSILTTIYLFDIFFKKFFKNFKPVSNQICLIILCIGLLFIHIKDTYLVKFSQNFDANNKKVSIVKKYATNINKHYKNGAMILQLPILTYPENYVSQKLTNCNFQVFPYLFTKNIKWSHGALNHTNESFFQKSLFGSDDIENDIINAKIQGFDGISINTDIYDYTDILASVKKILGKPLFVSKNNKLYFFDSTNYRIDKLANVNNINFIKDELYLGDGWSDLWPPRDVQSRWAFVESNKTKAKNKNLGGSTYVRFISYAKSPYKIVIKASSPIKNHLKVYLNNSIIGDFSVNKGDNVFETKYIYEDSSKNLYEPNLIKLEHSLSFKPSEIYKKSRDHRSLTLKYNEISLRD